MPSAEQLDRMQASLDAGAATGTDALTALLLEVGNETCYRRGRLLHRLSLILHAQRPQPMATSTTHRFKPAFHDTSVVVHDPATRTITAKNLADEDVAILQAQGHGHLIETLKAASAPEPETPAVVNTGLLLTDVERTEDAVIYKHSQGGPDDQPITAPVAPTSEEAATEPLPKKKK